MRAWILDRQAPVDEKPLRYVDDYPIPSVGEGDLLIRITHTGLCRTDLHILEGDLPLHKKPVILGHQIVGYVAETSGNSPYNVGDRVGLTWLYGSCGRCKYCLGGEENYCPSIVRTGWDVDGGYAEYVLAKEDFVIDLRDLEYKDSDLAPLMCPGVTGYLGFKLSRVEPGDKLGIIGYGPTAHYIMRICEALSIDVYVSTRSPHHQEMAWKDGAVWVGNILEEDFPIELDAVISFPPIGHHTKKVLKSIKPGGTLVFSQIEAYTDIHIDSYSTVLWGRRIETVYNVRRNIANELVNLAKRVDLSIDEKVIDFRDIMDYLVKIRRGHVDKITVVAKI